MQITNQSAHDRQQSMRVHKATELAAVIMTDVDEGDRPHEDQTMHVLLWRDGMMRITFPSGNKLDSRSPSGTSLDDMIQVAIEQIQCYAIRVRSAYADLMPLAEPQLWVYKVPAGLTKDLQILEWMLTVPGLILEADGKPIDLRTLEYELAAEALESPAATSFGGVKCGDLGVAHP